MSEIPDPEATTRCERKKRGNRTFWIAFFGFLGTVVPSCTTVLVMVLNRTLPPPPNSETLYDSIAIESRRSEDVAETSPIFYLEGEIDPELGVYRHVTLNKDGEPIDVIWVGDGNWVTKGEYLAHTAAYDIMPEQRVAADLTPSASK